MRPGKPRSARVADQVRETELEQTVPQSAASLHSAAWVQSLPPARPAGASCQATADCEVHLTCCRWDSEKRKFMDEGVCGSACAAPQGEVSSGPSALPLSTAVQPDSWLQPNRAFTSSPSVVPSSLQPSAVPSVAPSSVTAAPKSSRPSLRGAAMRLLRLASALAADSGSTNSPTTLSTTPTPSTALPTAYPTITPTAMPTRGTLPVSTVA